MALYKSGIEMFDKYSKKYNPTVIGTRFADVKDTALARAQAGLNAVATIRDMVRDYLDQAGVTGGVRATYIGFALKLWKHVNRQGGSASDKLAAGLISYFKTAYDLDETILTDIANSIIVKVTTPPSG
jgi:hypothetical protein